MNEKCKCRIYHDWTHSFVDCGRPAKGHLKNGVPACGIHLRVEKKAEQIEIEAKARHEKDMVFKKEVDDFCNGYDINSLIIKNTDRRKVTIDFDELKELLNRKA